MPSSGTVIEYYAPSLREKYLLGETAPIQDVSAGSNKGEIGWEPDFEKFQAQAAARLQSGAVDSTVPQGWPKSLDSPLVWSGADLHKKAQYVLTLTEIHKQEVVDALAYFNGEWSHNCPKGSS